MHKKRVSAKTCPEILKSLAAQLDTLSAEDLGTFGFSCLTEVDALPLLPPIACRREARCQSRIKIFTIGDPVHYRIFL